MFYFMEFTPMSMVPDISSAIRETEGYLYLDLVVRPKSDRDEVTGYDEWRNVIMVNVKAPPTKGKANQAVVDLFSAALELSKGDIEIVKGVRGTKKTLRVKGERWDVVRKVRQAALG